MQKVNLCDACSKEKGVQDPTGFALADLLLGIGAAEEIEKGGKVPLRAHRVGELSDRMRNLNESLQKAVAEENYETAASLRDQIKQLESELTS